MRRWQASMRPARWLRHDGQPEGGRVARGNDPAARQDLAHVVEHDHAVAQQAPPLLGVGGDRVGGVAVRAVSRRARGAVSTHCAPLVWAADVAGLVDPAVFGTGPAKDGTSRRSLRASPEGALAGGIFRSRPVGTAVPPESAAGTAGKSSGLAAPSGEARQLARLPAGLGAGCRRGGAGPGRTEAVTRALISCPVPAADPRAARPCLRPARRHCRARGRPPKIPPACTPSGDAPRRRRLLPSSGTARERGGPFPATGPDMATGRGDDSETHPYAQAKGPARAPRA